VVSVLSGYDFYILFNVLHLLAIGILFYALLTRREELSGRQLQRTNVLLLLTSAVLLWGASMLPLVAGHGRWWLLPLGLPPQLGITMSDYLPIVPWMGFFLVGTLIGRLVYAGRCSAFPGAPAWLIAASRPFAFMGRHSLVIYVLHQPVLLALLFGLRAIGLL
jgi:uncharacterized membrane protein